MGFLSTFLHSILRHKRTYPYLHPTKRKRNKFAYLNEKSKHGLSKKQKQLYEEIEKTSSHIFVTGKAGTGKSVLLRYLKDHSKKRMIVVAPTGVAALVVGGQTIHSLFRLPLSCVLPNSQKVNPKTAQLLRSLDAIVIDEVSMVRADCMDAIDSLLRQARTTSLPFGGVQVILFGDIAQLPPVVADSALQAYFQDTYGGYFFYHANVWKKTTLVVKELDTVFRQKESVFLAVLNAIREGRVDDLTLQFLNMRAHVPKPHQGFITLTLTNQTADKINQRHLQELSGNLKHYLADVSGAFEASSFPTQHDLTLKVGAQVMMLKNDMQRRWVNGTLATVYSLTPKSIAVKIGESIYTIQPEVWEKIEYVYDTDRGSISEHITSTFTQFPIRLAWAITVHKSQGQTFERVVFDLENHAFAHGQIYVGLSRCKSMENLYLSREITARDILVDHSHTAFLMNCKVKE